MPRTKKDLEKLESLSLAKYATKSQNSKGRRASCASRAQEEPNDARLCFQLDRDRIIHSKAFRRLDEKTQVFPAYFGDHYRTRLTHTLEVAQISRDICRRLGLNEDLAEAIALSHDLGHPPFGHAGEDALNEIMKEYGLNFEHNQQSQRVVEKLEKIYPDFDGLNLSIEVLEGLQKHQTIWDQSGKALGSMHFEGQVVNLADEIAYTGHDIDDGLRSTILSEDDLLDSAIWREAIEATDEKYGEIALPSVKRARVISRVIATMIENICENFNGKSVKFGDAMLGKIKELREILYNRFYLSEPVKEKLEEGKTMIKQLFNYYMKNLDRVPEKFRTNERPEIAVKDYIAGMTDQFLRKEIEKISK